MWVIDNQEVGTATSHGRTDTASEVLTTAADIPSTGSFTVGLECGLGEDSFEVVALDEVPDLSSKPLAKFCCVRSANNFARRVLSEKPSRKHVTR